jgi:1-acyl-sn-glycerol-3-phosphate acyltransferase
MPTEIPIESTPEARLLRVVNALVQETQPQRTGRVSINSLIDRDLGLDSLARVELLLRVGKEFGVSLPDAALAEALTPDDLLRFIGDAGSAGPTFPSASILANEAISELPEQAATLTEVLRWNASHHPQRTHVLLYGEDEQALPISYGELLNEAQAIAAGLIARGLRPRQTVALMLPTGRSYLCSFFAVMLAGGIPVPIYPPVRMTQIDDHLRRHAQILDNAQTVFIITIPQAKGIAALLRAKVPALAEIFSPDELVAPPMDLLYRATPDDIAFLQYTSGSTGNPKGVVLTHANLLANLRAMGQACSVCSDDVFVSWLPLYHDMGLIGAWFGALYFGFPLVLMSPLAFLARPSRWLAAISRHRGTISAAPNFAYELCAKKLADADLEGLDLSTWRLALNGAEPVSVNTLDAFAARFSPCGLRREAISPVYGLAECSVGLAFPPPGRGPRIDTISREVLVREQRAVLFDGATDKALMVRVAACGRALPGHEIRIIDASGNELAERHVGRLQFRGPSATQGYYRNLQATRDLIHEGWLDSGDLAYSVDGEIYLTGRIKDLIIRGGRNIYPYDLEQAVGNIPGLRRGGVAVFSMNDPVNAGERLVVLAETRESQPALRDALRQKINDAAIDVIGMPVDEIVLAPPNSVLKTSSGKIRRAASREAYQRGLIGTPAAKGWKIAWRIGAATLLARINELLLRTLRWSFAIWCWLIFSLLALPVATLVATLQTPTIGRRLVACAARLFFTLSGLPRCATGLEKLSDAPELLLVNHGSYLDALLLCASLPPRFVFVAKRELAENALMRAFLQGMGTLFVERFSAAKSAEDVKEIIAALRRGEDLIIFPEGTFSRESGLKAFHLGAFIAAARAGVPLRVCALRGTRDVLRDQSSMPRFGKMSLTVGDQFAPDGNDWAAAIRLREATRTHMLHLCGEHDLSR